MLKLSPRATEMLSSVSGNISSKRVLTNRVVWCFIGLATVIGVAIAVRIIMKGDVGLGAVGAFGAVTGPLAVTITFVYRKPENGSCKDTTSQP